MLFLKICLINLLEILYLLLLIPYIIHRVLLSKKYLKSWKSRLGFLDKEILQFFSKNSQRETIWVHAVSVGEVRLLASFLPKLQSQFSNCNILLTVTTESGYEQATQLNGYHCLTFMPLDIYPVISSFINRIPRLKLMILTETEIWPNLLYTAFKLKSKIVIINGRVSGQSFKLYQKAKFFLAPFIKMIDRALCQDAISASRLLELGLNPENAVITGNMKFDALKDLKSKVNPQLRTAEFKLDSADKIVTFGSFHPGEERFCVDCIKLLTNLWSSQKIRFFLVPRKLDKLAETIEVLNTEKIKFVKYSENKNLDNPIILIDKIGSLIDIYSISSLAFVGGSIVPTGGHNLLEPLLFGVPVFFGPHTFNFEDIKNLILKYQVGFQINSPDEFISKIKSTNDFFSLEFKENCQTVIEQGLGAVQLNLIKIQDLF